MPFTPLNLRCLFCEMSMIVFEGFDEKVLNLILDERRPSAVYGISVREHKPHEGRARDCLALCCPPPPHA